MVKPDLISILISDGTHLQTSSDNSAVKIRKFVQFPTSYDSELSKGLNEFYQKDTKKHMVAYITLKKIIYNNFCFISERV